MKGASAVSTISHQRNDMRINDKPDFDLSFDMGLKDIVDLDDETERQDTDSVSVVSGEFNDANQSRPISKVIPYNKMSGIGNSQNVGVVKTSPVLSTTNHSNRESHLYHKQRNGKSVNNQISPVKSTRVSDTHLPRKQISNNTVNDRVSPVKSISIRDAHLPHQQIDNKSMVDRGSPVKSMSKEERLRISRQKREEFKRKHAEKLKQNSSVVESNKEAVILDHTLPNSQSCFFNYVPLSKQIYLVLLV